MVQQANDSSAIRSKITRQLQITILITRWLYCVECPQYSIRLETLGYLCTSCLLAACIRQGLVSCDSIVNVDWLPATEWCHRYQPCCQPASDVRRGRKFGQVSCTECTGQGNDFELILTVIMETRNPVNGYFSSEFSAICNHCEVMAA